MKYPELVSNLTEDQGIGIAIIGESIADSGLEFCQYYGKRQNCEMFDEDVCSHDGNLWGSNDMGSPYFCTKHAIPQEQLGYEFVNMVAYIDRPVATEFEVVNRGGEFTVTLVDYYQGDKQASRMQLPMAFTTYKEASDYGWWWLEEYQKPISQGFKVPQLTLK